MWDQDRVASIGEAVGVMRAGMGSLIWGPGCWSGL